VRHQTNDYLPSFEASLPLPSTDTKLYCLVTQAGVRKRLAQGRTQWHRWDSFPWPLDWEFDVLPLGYQATALLSTRRWCVWYGTLCTCFHCDAVSGTNTLKIRQAQWRSSTMAHTTRALPASCIICSDWSLSPLCTFSCRAEGDIPLAIIIVVIIIIIIIIKIMNWVFSVC